MGIFSEWAAAKETNRLERELRDERQRQERAAEHNKQMAFLQSVLGAQQQPLAQMTVPKRHAPPEGLSHYRLSDLAGYLGRVHEQLCMAAILATPLDSDAEKTRKTALAQHFQNAAAKAQAIQNDLIGIAQELRDKEERDAVEASMAEALAAIDAQRNAPSQWTGEELVRAARAHPTPLEPNQIKAPFDCCLCYDGALAADGACPACGKGPEA